MPMFSLEIVECPECAAPAEVAERFVLESTDGPIEHAIVVCLHRHRFTMLVERLMSSSSGLTGALDDTARRPRGAPPGATREPRGPSAPGPGRRA
jgi:hypothetical protein